MKNTTKKMLAMLLSIVMALSICFVPAYAAEIDNPMPITEPSSGYSIAPLAYSDEDTAVFYIPIADPVTRSIYNLEVSLTGDKTTRTVTATVENTMALGFSTIDIELALYSERTATVLQDVAYDNDWEHEDFQSKVVAANLEDMIHLYYQDKI